MIACKSDKCESKDKTPMLYGTYCPECYMKAHHGDQAAHTLVLLAEIAKKVKGTK